VFYQLGLDPLSECQNPALLAGFLSEMGKIYGREVTGLTTKNQRRLGKAIRRAKMMGVIPILSSPPDLQQKRR
jgi:small subunit ribosomal protein S18